MSFDAKLATLDKKLDAILTAVTAIADTLAKFTPPPPPEPRKPVETAHRDDAVRAALMDSIMDASGKFTASELAEMSGLPNDMGTLMAIGRVMDSLGVKRIRSNTKRQFQL